MHSRTIETYKQTLQLTNEQREVLVGLLLGDACLESQNAGRTYRLKVEQSAHHEAYVRHIYSLFRPWVLTPPRLREAKASNGKVTTSWVFQTVSHASFRFYAHQFYRERRKCVPVLIQRWLTPRGLAYWFMDDGSMKSNQSKGVLFNTQCFPAPDVERLVQLLQSQFGLQAKPRRQKDGMQIYVSGGSCMDFVKYVGSYVIDEMRYKLPQARRTRLPKE
jgi:hypothetical protein